MRGLESLIPPRKESQTSREKESVFLIETENIYQNPYQPRKEFDPKELERLTDSIRKYGILQPLVVSKKSEDVPSGRRVRYELIAGERRLRAAQLAKFPHVPVIIREATDNEKLELSLIENIQRQDLNAIEEAGAYRRLQDEFGLSQGEIAERVGKSRPTVANAMRILRLSQDIQGAVASGKISDGHTRPLLSLATAEAQSKLFEEIVQKEMSVRDTEERARQILQRANRGGAGHAHREDMELKNLASQLKEKISLSRVHVRADKKSARLALEFSTRTDLVSWIKNLLG